MPHQYILYLKIVSLEVEEGQINILLTVRKKDVFILRTGSN